MHLKEESTHVVACKQPTTHKHAKNAAEKTSAIPSLPFRMNKTAFSL